MKREIKFRGQCQITKDFVFGDLLHGVGHKSGKVYILPNKVKLAGVKHCDPLDGVEVIPESVGQFTGLTDKNGAEIYEGDLIELLENKTGTALVEFRNAYVGGWILTNSGQSASLGARKPSEVEVLGNIHQNPELL